MDDVYELLSLHGSLWQRELREATRQAKVSIPFVLFAIGLAVMGTPMLIVGGLIALAEASAVSPAIVVCIVGGCFLASGAAMAWYLIRGAASREWFPRSRAQGKASVEAMIARLPNEANAADAAHGSTSIL